MSDLRERIDIILYDISCVRNADKGDAQKIISMVLDKLKEKTLNLKAGKHDRRVFLQIIDELKATS